MLPVIDQRGEYTASEYFTQVYQASRAEIERLTGLPESKITQPCSIGVYEHLGRNQAEADRIVGDMQLKAITLLAAWERAGEYPTDGGGCYYRPVAILLSNYGAAVYSDLTSCRVSSHYVSGIAS